MGQDRLNNLARLSIEPDIAKNIDFDTVIAVLPRKGHARQPCFNKVSLFANYKVHYYLYIFCRL